MRTPYNTKEKHRQLDPLRPRSALDDNIETNNRARPHEHPALSEEDLIDLA